MKILIVAAVVATQLYAQSATRSAFEGTWLRQEVVGKNGKALPRITWTLTLDDKAIALIESSQTGMASRVLKYNLDGSEASYTVQSRPDANVTKLLTRKERLIEIMEVMPSVGGGNLKISETWELGSDGNTLKVTRKFQIRNADGPMPIGMADRVYTFERVSAK